MTDFLSTIEPETLSRMRLAGITIEPDPDQADQAEPDEFEVWQEGRLVRTGTWRECMRWIEWVCSDEP